MLTTMKREFDVLNDLEQDAKVAPWSGAILGEQTGLISSCLISHAPGACFRGVDRATCRVWMRAAITCSFARTKCATEPEK